MWQSSQGEKNKYDCKATSTLKQIILKVDKLSGHTSIFDIVVQLWIDQENNLNCFIVHEQDTFVRFFLQVKTGHF